DFNPFQERRENLSILISDERAHAQFYNNIGAEYYGNGDAATALSLGAATPASTALLTDDVLGQQIQKMPITNIVVQGEVETTATNTDRVYIKASADFGETPSTGLIALIRANDSWKLRSAFLNARDPGHGIGTTGRAVDTLEIGGQPVGDSGVVAVFPGAWNLSTTNPFLDVSPPPPLLLDRLQYGAQSNVFSPVFSLNDTGKQAIRATITKWVTDCFIPGGATPAGPCDLIEPTRGGTYLPGTARLDGPMVLEQWAFSLDQSLKVLVSVGDVHIPFTAERPAGTVENSVWRYIVTPVDISKNPPVVMPPGPHRLG
ncbi:MAG: hypothetical protein ACPGVG_16690, partial [Mycobacterium sp.]